MSRIVNSDALDVIADQLGIVGTAEGTTVLNDDDLLQSFDTHSGVRRGRADIATAGWFYGILENVHGAADAEVSNINPYAALANAVNTYPERVSDKFDVWLHGVSVRRISGTGILTEATATFLVLARAMGWGVDDSGDPVTEVAVPIPLARWNSISDTGGNVYGLNGPNGEVYVRVNMRVPVQGFIQFESVSSALSTWQMMCVLGLFPVGMGSDVAT